MMLESIEDVLKSKFNAETDYHCSDLYVKHTEEIYNYLRDNYEFFCNVKTFISQIDNKKWIDIPFAYSQYWFDKKYKGVRK